MHASHAGLLVYADHSSPATGTEAFAAVRKGVAELRTSAHPLHDAISAALIEAGILEAAVADALLPDRDDVRPVLKRLREATDALGEAMACSWWGQRTRAATLVGDADNVLRAIETDMLPRELSLRTPEGYAFYAVYPEAYAHAAREWCRRARPGRVVCLGLRSIGTSLASAARGGLAAEGVLATTWTLRPRGHPFDRRVEVDPSLVHEWRRLDPTFLLVDEGPGLSGSSLAGAAAFLGAHGVPPTRIVFLAAWYPDVRSLRSANARQAWLRHEVITATFDHVRNAVLQEDDRSTDIVDVSGGRWREMFLSCDGAGDPRHAERDWPAVQPQHERVKVVSPGGTLLKFAGLGRFGHLALGRAERLAGAGWAPHVSGIAKGFLGTGVVNGTPLSRNDVGGAFLTHASKYLAWLRCHESTTSAADVTPLAAMLEVNAGEALPPGSGAAVARLVNSARVFEEPAIAVDGRLQLHEWIGSGDRFLKTDALDHHRDHFLPGTADSAWDVAGMLVEAGVAAPERDAFLRSYARESGDGTICRRLPFYEAAYCAFRLGYCTLAGESVEGRERERFAASRDRYARGLMAVLATA